MIVMKFGGTSVGSAERIKHVANLINNSKKPTIAVLSAMAGTTNKLVTIASKMYCKKCNEAIDIINELEKQYIKEAGKLFSTNEMLQKTTVFLKEKMDLLRSFADDLFTTYEEKCVLAQGELMSTQMMLNYMKEVGINAAMLPALDFMRTDKNGLPDMTLTKKLLAEKLGEVNSVGIFITQGFICRNAFDEIDNLKRGGSDYSASLIGAAINADEVEIWTDIDGMHNNDPRIVEKTQRIDHLSYDEASELAYFGAKILHPTCVRPAKEASISLRLKNTLEPTSPGTLIDNRFEENKIKAVAAKDDVVMIHIVNTKNMPMHIFLASVYDICDNYQSTVFTSACAENGLSICIEKEENIENIIDEIKHVGLSEVHNKVCIISIVGDLSPSNTQFLAQSVSAMQTTDIRMMSFGGGKHSISFVIDTKEKEKAMKNLNKHLFNQ